MLTADWETDKAVTSALSNHCVLTSRKTASVQWIVVLALVKHSHSFKNSSLSGAGNPRIKSIH